MNVINKFYTYMYSSTFVGLFKRNCTYA